MQELSLPTTIQTIMDRLADIGAELKTAALALANAASTYKTAKDAYDQAQGYAEVAIRAEREKITADHVKALVVTDPIVIKELKAFRTAELTFEQAKIAFAMLEEEQARLHDQTRILQALPELSPYL